jgi:hypothetical protein
MNKERFLLFLLTCFYGSLMAQKLVSKDNRWHLTTSEYVCVAGT